MPVPSSHQWPAWVIVAGKEALLFSAPNFDYIYLRPHPVTERTPVKTGPLPAPKPIIKDKCDYCASYGYKETMPWTGHCTCNRDENGNSWENVR